MCPQYYDEFHLPYIEENSLQNFKAIFLCSDAKLVVELRLLINPANSNCR